MARFQSWMKRRGMMAKGVRKKAEWRKSIKSPVKRRMESRAKNQREPSHLFWR